MKENILNQIQLYLVTDEAACLGRDFYWVVEEAVKGGVTMVQLREKTLGTRAFIERGKRLKDLLAPYHVPLIINDRVDVALAIDADGVHVGQNDMHYNMLKDLWLPEKIVGISAETREDVFEAETWKISYLAASPLFFTASKTDTETPWGKEGLKWMRQNSRHPLVVIGGLNDKNAAEALRNGANGIAVISAICSAESPFQAATQLMSIFNKSNLK
ncbi:thiamine phosphate synthase [Dyadobacter psychrotolerans]|uniref:Thiamine-phosphate synthase n=1 Tax=Dyadobacter psychrotolerans TaxID=2541721 RepID=A0A4R5E2V0_9BACT|nr:thiamine phosphate synthase [Dyadobacter psychrotolerans]TDE18573.1 thiamine phosphate synthase [Dyadobacter psychrotolerans]